MTADECVTEGQSLVCVEAPPHGSGTPLELRSRPGRVWRGEKERVKQKEEEEEGWRRTQGGGGGGGGIGTCLEGLSWGGFDDGVQLECRECLAHLWVGHGVRNGGLIAVKSGSLAQ